MNNITPEKETPTTKTVEEVVAEWDELIKVATKFELRTWLRQTLLAQNQAADERLREVFKQLLELADTEADGEVWLYGRHLKTIAAKHGITNL